MPNDPIYKTRDGQRVTKAQLLNSGYSEDRINKGLEKGVLDLIGDTETPTQLFKTKDGQSVTTEQLLQSGYSQDRINNGVNNGILVPEEILKKNGTLPTTGKVSVIGTEDISTQPLPLGSVAAGVAKGISEPLPILDTQINGYLSKYKGAKVSVSGGTGGAAVSISVNPLSKINLDDPTQYAGLIDAISSLDGLSEDGKIVSGKKQELLNLLNERLFTLKVKQDIDPEITQLNGKVQEAITRVNLLRERGENIPTDQYATNDQLNQRHLELGLNYVKDADRGKYINVINSIEKKGQIADTDFEQLATLGQQLYNRKVAIDVDENIDSTGTQTNLDYTTYQDKKASYAGTIGEWLKKQGYKNYRQFPENLIRRAAAASQLPNKEIVDDLIAEEKILGYDAIPKSGGLEAFVRGIQQPLYAIKNTVDDVIDSPVDTYLKSRKLDVGTGQKVADEKGMLSAELPSDRGNIWYDALEGFGQFIPQVLLAKSIGRPISGLVGRAVGSTASRAALTAAQSANITNYTGTFISTYFQEYGPNYESALQKTGDHATARLMGNINSVFASGFELFLPDAKIADKAAGILRKNHIGDLVDLIKKGGDPATLAKGGRSIIGKAVTQVLDIERQEVSEELATNITDFVTESIFSPRTAKDRDLGNELMETAKATAIAMSIPAILGAGGSVNKEFTVNGFNSAAINLPEYKQYLGRALMNEQISDDEYNQAIQLLQTHRQSINSAPKQDINGKELSDQQILDYAYEETQRKINSERADKAAGVQKEVYEKKVKDIQDAQRDVLMPSTQTDDLSKYQPKPLEEQQAVQKDEQVVSTEQNVLRTEQEIENLLDPVDENGKEIVDTDGNIVLTTSKLRLPRDIADPVTGKEKMSIKDLKIRATTLRELVNCLT